MLVVRRDRSQRGHHHFRSGHRVPGETGEYLQFFIGSFAARVVLAFFFIPAFYKFNCVTIYEFLKTPFRRRDLQYAGDSVSFRERGCSGSGGRSRSHAQAVAVLMGAFIPTLFFLHRSRCSHQLGRRARGDLDGRVAGVAVSRGRRGDAGIFGDGDPRRFFWNDPQRDGRRKNERVEPRPCARRSWIFQDDDLVRSEYLVARDFKWPGSVQWLLTALITNSCNSLLTLETRLQSHEGRHCGRQMAGLLVRCWSIC